MGIIIRGTTPTLAFKIKNDDMDLTQIAEVWITFKTKAGIKVKEKTYDINDVTIDTEEREILLSLTQEDTLDFTDTNMLVQLRLRMTNDEAFASSIFDTDIGHILKEGVI